MKFLFFLILKQLLVFIHAQAPRAKARFAWNIRTETLSSFWGIREHLEFLFCFENRFIYFKACCYSTVQYSLDCSERRSVLREQHRCAGLVSMPKRDLTSLRVEVKATTGVAGGHHMLSEKGQTMTSALLWHLLKNANPFSYTYQRVRACFPELGWAWVQCCEEDVDHEF